MKTTATLPAIAKALDRLVSATAQNTAQLKDVSMRVDGLVVRLDRIEERQIQMALDVRKITKRVGKLEKEVTAMRKTMDRMIDYEADTRIAGEELIRKVDRLRERSEKTFDHFDAVVTVVDRHREQIEFIREHQEHTDRKIAALAK